MAASSVSAVTTVLWKVTWDSPNYGRDASTAIAVNRAGTMVYVTGYSQDEEGVSNWGTVAYRAGTGRRVWAAMYDDPHHVSDKAEALAVSPDGSKVFVTGGINQSYGYCDVGTVAYDALTGAKLWIRTYDGIGTEYDCDQPVAVFVSPGGGRVYVVAQTWDSLPLNNLDFTVLTYAADTGQRLGVSQTDLGGGVHEVTGAALAPNGSRVFITGEVGRPFADKDYATVAFDAHTGSLLWSRFYASKSYGTDHPFALAVSPDSSTVYVTGVTRPQSANGDRIPTFAYDATTGHVRWRAVFHGADAWGRMIAASPDGSSVFIGATERDAAGGLDHWTILRCDSSDGHLVWQNSYSHLRGDISEQPDAIGVSPNSSGVYVTGIVSRGSDVSLGWATVKFRASDGTRVWAAPIIPGPTLSTGKDALAVDPGGDRVFITGTSTGGTLPDLYGPDYITVSFAA